MSGGENLETDVSVRGEGPILVSEFAAGWSITLPDDIACAFITELRKHELDSDLYTTGILNKGTNSVSRVIGPELTGETEVNGSGLMSFGSHTIGNTTIRSSGFVAGNMTLRDFVKFGGKI